MLDSYNGKSKHITVYFIKHDTHSCNTLRVNTEGGHKCRQEDHDDDVTDDSDTAW
jgi:hypothetical protein